MSSSSLFLSGEADPTLQSQREERLSSMLLESTSRLKKKDDTVGDGKEKKEKKKVPPLRMIQVIDEKTPDQLDVIDDDNHDNDDDDDDDESDGPPPLCSVESPSNISTPKHISNTYENELNSNNRVKGNAAISRQQQQQLDHNVGDDDVEDDDQGPSLMEQMMADASKARAEKEKVRKARERKDAKSSSLSYGLKKGFLNSNSKSSNNNGAKNSSSNNNNKTGKERKSPSSSSNSSSFRKGFLDSGTKPKMTSSKSDRGNKDNESRRGGNPPMTEEDVYELDSEGNILPSTITKSKLAAKPKAQGTKSTTIRPKSSKTATIDLKPSATTKNNNNYNNPLCFQEVQEAMNKNDPLYKLSKGEWATPDLMEKISQNPRLMAGMANPKFAAALEALAQDPKKAMSKFEHHPDVADFLREFCGVLGEHFVQLGEEEGRERGVNGDAQTQTKQQESMGPMAEAALKREQERISRGKESWNQNLKQEEKRKLDEIMSNEKLTALLMDPDMQRVMQECSVPGRMQMYATHPEYGPKLRLMMEAGLLRFA